MSITDQLVRAAVYAAMDARDTWDGDQRTLAASPYGRAIAEIVNVHRAAPLTEYAVELRQARRALLLAEAAYEAQRWDREAPDWMAA
jgi:hypothetical protein